MFNNLIFLIMNSTLFSEKQIATFKQVAESTGVKTNNRTAEKWLTDLFETLKGKAEKNSTEKAVFNTLVSMQYVETRQYRVTTINEKGRNNGVMQAIKLAGINATKTNPVNVKNLAAELSAKFNKDLNKTVQNIRNQFRPVTGYMAKEHGVKMDKIDADNFYCTNPDFAKLRLNK